MSEWLSAGVVLSIAPSIKPRHRVGCSRNLGGDKLLVGGVIEYTEIEIAKRALAVLRFHFVFVYRPVPSRQKALRFTLQEVYSFLTIPTVHLETVIATLLPTR